MNEDLDLPLEDWRAVVQDSIYRLLGAWADEAGNSFVLMQEAREQLASAMVYGNYRDIAMTMKLMNDTIEKSVNTVLKMTGQFDSPAQVAITLNQVNREEMSPAVQKISELDSAQRERVTDALREVFGQARSLLVEATSEESDAAQEETFGLPSLDPTGGGEE